MSSLRYDAMTCTELRKEASIQGVVGRSKMNKDELVQALEALDGEGSASSDDDSSDDSTTQLDQDDEGKHKNRNNKDNQNKEDTQAHEDELDDSSSLSSSQSASSMNNDNDSSGDKQEKEDNPSQNAQAGGAQQILVASAPSLQTLLIAVLCTVTILLVLLEIFKWNPIRVEEVRKVKQAWEEMERK